MMKNRNFKTYFHSWVLWQHIASPKNGLYILKCDFEKCVWWWWRWWLWSSAGCEALITFHVSNLWNQLDRSKIYCFPLVLQSSERSILFLFKFPAFMWSKLIEIALKVCSENPKVIFVEKREGADIHNSQLKCQNSNMNIGQSIFESEI